MAGNATNIRQQNREAVSKSILNNIRKHQSISRVDLCRTMNISKPTITNIVAELLERGLIVETGTLESNVGRKRICLEINADYGYSVSINLTVTTAYVSLVDMRLHTHASRTLSILACQDEKALLEELSAAVSAVIADADIAPDKLLGIGVSCPGFVDYRKGILLNFATDSVRADSSQKRSLGVIRMKDYLEKRFQLPVMVENDANVYALGECWYGQGVDYNNVLLILCGEEVGSSIIFRGHILRGKVSLNHGIGHLMIDPQGPVCGCGRHGCVESFASHKAILQDAARLYRDGASTALTIAPEKLSIRAIGEGADEGDPLCCTVMKRAATAVGKGIAMLSGIVNPELVILTGSTVEASSFFYTTVVEAAKKHSFGTLYRYIDFAPLRQQDNVYGIGAAALIFRKYIY